MSFFDVGDAAQAGALTILPPTDSNVGASFPGCTYTPPPGNSTGPPWGTLQPTNAGCKITGVSSTNYNGQWIEFRIPDSRHVLVQLQRPVRVLDTRELRLPRRRPRHDDVDGATHR